MSYLIKSAKIIYSIYAATIFLALLFLIFPFVVIASFFGKIKGGNFIYVLCRFWADSFFLLAGIFHRNYFEGPHNTIKPSVIVFNHISYMDIPIIMKAIRKQKFRILGKAELAKIPFFGFIYKYVGVQVDRSSPENRAKSVKQLKSILRKNISVALSPEGTFNTTHRPLKDFYDGAFKIAIEIQVPIQPVLFLDAYDRMPYENFFLSTPGRSRAVFLEEIPTVGLTLEDVERLKQKVYSAMEEGLIKFKASWIRDARELKIKN